MPNRILREGILTSPKIAKLGWPEEVLYRRLMSLVDDFGRYFASPDIVRGHAFPRQLSKVSDSDVVKWIRVIEEAGLVRVYPAEDGESYLELLNFGQQVRATKSKFPNPPPIENTCNQLLANERLDVSVSVSVSEVVIPAAPRVELFEEFWKSYPKKKAKDDAKKAFDKRKPDRQLLDAMLAAIAVQSRSEDWVKDGGKFIPYPATWLNDGRWQDGETVELTPPIRGPDPALAKIIADDKKAAPIPENIRNQLAGMRFKFKEAA